MNYKKRNKEPKTYLSNDLSITKPEPKRGLGLIAKAHQYTLRDKNMPPKKNCQWRLSNHQTDKKISATDKTNFTSSPTKKTSAAECTPS
jgi:hypothetical protein